MPAVRLGSAGSQVRVARTGTSFTHISTPRTLGQASSDIRVRLLLEDFNPTAPANHTVACQLIIGGNTVNPASTRDEIVDGRSRWREFRFAPAATTSYRIRIEGTGVTAQHPWHVAERYDLAL